MSASTHVEHTIARLHAIDGLQLDMPGAAASGQNLAGDHPTFALMPAAREAVREALDRGETHYADVPGIAPLREAVASALRAWNLEADPQDGVIVTAGEQEARFLALQALAQAGYRLAFPSIVHPGARKAAALGHTQQTRFGIDAATLVPDLGEIRSTLAAGPTALYLESPNRLTGKVIERAQVEAIAGAVRQAGAVVLWDATLVGWVPEGTPYTMLGALPGMEERVITMGTLWSGLGLDDWTAAFVAGPPALCDAARSLKQIIAICTTTPAQWGVLGALKAGAEGHAARRRALQAQREAAVREWPRAALPGEAASVLAVRLPKSGVDLSGLPSAPMAGEAFGAPGVVRFAVAPTGETTAALRALAARYTR